MRKSTRAEIAYLLLRLLLFDEHMQLSCSIFLLPDSVFFISPGNIGTMLEDFFDAVSTESNATLGVTTHVADLCCILLDWIFGALHNMFLLILTFVAVEYDSLALPLSHNVTHALNDT